MQSKKWDVPFSLGSLMIMAMLSVRRKHSSCVAVGLSGITETHNVPLRWFSLHAARTDYLWESRLEASSSFLLRGGTYGSGILKRLHLLEVLVFYAFILFLTLCETIFPSI